MNSEISKKEIMTKAKSKKTTKKKNTVEKKGGGSNPPPSFPKLEIPSSSQVAVTRFKELEGNFLLVKVGNKDLPATDADIEDVEKKLVKLLEDNNINCLAFVTHHAVEMKIVEKLT